MTTASTDPVVCACAWVAVGVFGLLAAAMVAFMVENWLWQRRHRQGKE